MIKDNEKGLRNYTKLLYYFKNKKKVHINSIKGFRNGIILSLDKSVVVINDKIKVDDIFLEDIYEDSINRYLEVSD